MYSLETPVLVEKPVSTGKLTPVSDITVFLKVDEPTISGDQLYNDLRKVHALNGADPEGTDKELLKTAGSAGTD